jgi:chemotaxis protein CheD
MAIAQQQESTRAQTSAAAHWSTAPRAPLDMHCLQVGMGQLKIGARTEQLQALLGSCVGIGLIWKKRGLCGLAHCLLPEAPQGQDHNNVHDLFSARYVSRAVPAMLRLMGATEADYADIQVIVSGGATMLNACSSRLQIGQQNVDSARKYLRLLGLEVHYSRVGGKCGRMMTIDCATQDFTVHEIVKTTRDTSYANA